MIRHATLDDIPAIVQLGQTIMATTDVPSLRSVNADVTAATARRLVDAPEEAVVLVSQAAPDAPITGVIALALFTHPISGARLAGEVVWFVTPEARGTWEGVRLLRQAEAWAKAQGASAIQMIAPSPRVAQFYEAAGYQPLETAYQRRM